MTIDSKKQRRRAIKEQRRALRQAHSEYICRFCGKFIINGAAARVNHERSMHSTQFELSERSTEPLEALH